MTFSQPGKGKLVLAVTCVESVTDRYITLCVLVSPTTHFFKNLEKQEDEEKEKLIKDEDPRVFRHTNIRW